MALGQSMEIWHLKDGEIITGKTRYWQLWVDSQTMLHHLNRFTDPRKAQNRDQTEHCFVPSIDRKQTENKQEWPTALSLDNTEIDGFPKKCQTIDPWQLPTVSFMSLFFLVLTKKEELKEILKLVFG